MQHLQSSDITELISALVEAKKEFKHIVFDKSGNRNGYASIGAILNAVEQALLKHKISIEFKEDFDLEHKVPLLYTRILHASGQWSSNRALLRPELDGPIKSANQQYGASLSYQKRYSLASLLGLFADNIDVDNYDYDKISDEEIKHLKTLKPESISKILSYNKVNNLEELTSDQYKNIVKMLKR